MASALLDGSVITDWDTFHRESSRVFGFPDFYGRNMSAWIDCMSTLRDNDGMSSFLLKQDEVLRIEVLNSLAWRSRAPNIAAVFEDAIGECNERYREHGEKPALELVFR